MNSSTLFLCFILLIASSSFAANIDRFNLPEIPAQHVNLKQKLIDPSALNKFKECVANCALNELNKYPHDQKPGKQNLAAIQKCADGCNAGKK